MKPTIQTTAVLIAIALASVAVANLETAQSASQVEVADCIVRFASELKVPALETGLIEELKVKQNDMVTARDQIARLDDQTLLKRRRAAALELEAAMSDAADDSELQYAKTARDEAEAELAMSKSSQKDFRGVIPETYLTKLRLAVERGKLEIAQAELRKKRAVMESEVRQAEVSLIDDQLSKLHAESRISGVVLNLSHSAGEWINKGETIATIGQIDRLHVHALVDSKDLSPAICKGLPVSVRWNASSTGQLRALRGNVLSVDPQMLPNGVFRLHAEIQNENVGGDSGGWVLMPGMEVQMTIYVSAATARSANGTSIR
ncbi:HlyD family secretion protein [Rubripirellula reticaptiva]|uniref:HlyD family secretion protein n=1 Tax=Rubripirellula reticaptiva TaxID=2528013 RepID=A0A5C6F693_9BACT|nr:HlyD family efflux transporter periplasmic adaptor subunit [Rubripirellula reticaptiva]TWU56054.1 HlyD family secretion protein [Rubripirellula reticaptiva]